MCRTKLEHLCVGEKQQRKKKIKDESYVHVTSATFTLGTLSFDVRTKNGIGE